MLIIVNSCSDKRHIQYDIHEANEHTHFHVEPIHFLYYENT